MVTLTNPINAQNIVDRFADYVVATANSGIVWATDNVPQGNTAPTNGTVPALVDVINPVDFGGTTAGRPISITGNDIGGVGATITASSIYSVLVAQTNAYTSIRLVNGTLDVLGEGGNTGTRLTNSGNIPGRTSINVFNDTQVAYMSSSYLQSISIGPASSYGINSNSLITSANLQGFFAALQSAYLTARNNVVSYPTTVCHASCHSSCHGSRGRR